MDKGAAKTVLCNRLENLSGLVPCEVRRLGNITANMWWSSHCLNHSGVVHKKVDAVLELAKVYRHNLSLRGFLSSQTSIRP